jgi:hypothetical protein
MIQMSCQADTVRRKVFHDSGIKRMAHAYSFHLEQNPERHQSLVTTTLLYLLPKGI